VKEQGKCRKAYERLFVADNRRKERLLGAKAGMNSGVEEIKLKINTKTMEGGARIGLHFEGVAVPSGWGRGKPRRRIVWKGPGVDGGKRATAQKIIKQRSRFGKKRLLPLLNSRFGG